MNRSFPTPHMRFRRSIGCLLALLILLAGCGGGDDDNGSAEGTTVLSTAPPTTAGASTTLVAPTIPSGTDPVRVSKAKAAVFQDGDFPPPFKPEPEAMLNLDLVWEELISCMGVNLGPPLGSATSVTYLRGIATQGRSTVEYRPAAEGQALAGALAGPRFTSCAQEVFAGDVKRTAPEGGTAGPVEVKPLDFPKLGQTVSATRINTSVVFPDLKIDLFQDFLVIFDGEVVLRFFFLNPGDVFPEDLERQVVEKVIRRAA